MEKQSIIGFNCIDYGQFQISPSPNKKGKRSYFQMTLEDQDFQILETQVVGKRRLVLKVEPFEKTLKEFIEEKQPKKVSEYGSRLLYPTEEAKYVIQGLVIEVSKLKKEGKSHRFLHYADNILLQQENYPNPGIKVSIIHSKQGIQMEDDQALENLIFRQILGYTLEDYENGRVPPEWAHFWDLFYAKVPDYDLIATHSCLWTTTKKFDYYPVLYGWLHDPLNNKVDITNSLESMEIFHSNWISLIEQSDSDLARVKSQHRGKYKLWNVDSLIKFLRHTVVHVQENVGRWNLYAYKKYIVFSLEELFPGVVAEINARLFKKGYIHSH